MIYLILNARSDNWTTKLLQTVEEIPRLSIAGSALNAGMEFPWNEVMQISFPETYTEPGMANGRPWVRSELEQIRWVDNFIKNSQLLKYKNRFKDFWIFTQSHIIFTQFRVAIKEQRLKSNNIRIIFFDADEEVHEPILDSDGRLDYQPEGMFDNYRGQMRKLL